MIINKFFKSFFLLFVSFWGNLILAQPQCPTCPPGQGGAGGNNPGAASPIDDYLFLLIPLAVVMIIYFAKKYRKQLN